MSVTRMARPYVEWMLKKKGWRLVRDERLYQSETSKCRERLGPYCIGYGLDIGFGGDPITDGAIRVDFATPYAMTGSYSVQLGGDAGKLVWFADNALDFIYSSHLLEDFEDTKGVLTEWLRVLKPGGRLIIFCPDEQAYRRHCAATAQAYNNHHIHPDLSLAKVQSILRAIAGTSEIHSCLLIDDYSLAL